MTYLLKKKKKCLTPLDDEKALQAKMLDKNYFRDTGSFANFENASSFFRIRMQLKFKVMYLCT